MYAELLTIWKEERSLGSSLANIPTDLYQRATKYLAHLETTASLKDNPIAKGLLQQKASRVSFLIRDLLRIRINKLLFMVNEGKKIPVDNITIEEHEFIYHYNVIFQDLLKKVFQYNQPQKEKPITEQEPAFIHSASREELSPDLRVHEQEEHHASIENPVIEPEILEEGYMENTIEVPLSYVEITVDYLNEFVGVDLRPYGPFEKGDVILLPKENVNHLVRTNQGKEITVFYEERIRPTTIYIPEET